MFTHDFGIFVISSLLTLTFVFVGGCVSKAFKEDREEKKAEAYEDAIVELISSKANPCFKCAYKDIVCVDKSCREGLIKGLKDIKKEHS